MAVLYRDLSSAGVFLVDLYFSRLRSSSLSIYSESIVQQSRFDQQFRVTLAAVASAHNDLGAQQTDLNSG